MPLLDAYPAFLVTFVEDFGDLPLITSTYPGITVAQHVMVRGLHRIRMLCIVCVCVHHMSVHLH